MLKVDRSAYRPADLEEGANENFVLNFLLENYKILGMASLCGLCLALILSLLINPRYESVGYIAMAELSDDSLSIAGTPVESISSLTLRLNSTTKFDSSVEDKCDQSSATQQPFKNVKISPARGIPNVLELKVSRSSAESSKECIAAIFEYIISSQSDIANEYIHEAKLLFADAVVRLNKVNDLIKTADENGGNTSLLYLVLREERLELINYTRKAKNFINSKEFRRARPIVSINVSGNLNKVNSITVMLVGIFFGLFSGTVIILIYRKVLILIGTNENKKIDNYLLSKFILLNFNVSKSSNSKLI